MVTTTQVPAGVNNYYNRVMLDRAKPALVHAKWGQERDIPANNSNVIKFRRYNALAPATTPLDEGVTPTGNTLSVTDITATVKQYGDFIELTDVLQFTTLDPILEETAGVLGQQAGETIDILTRDVLHTTSSVQYASTATQMSEITTAMKLTKDEVTEAVLTLKLANAQRISSLMGSRDGFNSNPLNASYVGIVGPRTTRDLKAASGFVPVQNYAAPEQRYDFEVGALDEVRFVETTQSKVYAAAGNGGIDVQSTLILGQNAYGITKIGGQSMKNIVKPLGAGDDPLNQRSTSGWKATHVAVILNDAWMLKILHYATA